MTDNIEVHLKNFPKLLHVLELIVLFEEQKNNTRNKPSSDIYSFASDFQHLPKCNSIGKQSEDFVIKSIVNHRYQEAIKLLWMLCQDTSVYTPFIFKAVMIVLLNLEFSEKTEVLWKFISSIQGVKIMNKREVQLEYLMYALKNDLSTSQGSFEQLTSLRRKTVLRKNEKIDLIFTAYTALLDYIDWSKTYSGETSSQNQASAGKAKFENFLENSGDWDIFIPKLIKMMESCDKQDEIENVLLKYATKNPNNVNAFIYICEYLYHTNPGSENLIKCLKILADMCPSDVRVLWLIKIWNKQEIKHIKCLKYIFMFLDYPANGNNQIAWKILLQNISKANDSEKSNSAMKSLWTKRYKCWEWMYFNKHKVSQLDVNDSVIPYKIAVLSLLDNQHTFILEVQSQFPSIIETANSLKDNFLTCEQL